MAAATAPSLAQLRDIHLPPPVSWWPPAPGWWLLLSLLVLLAGALWWWQRRCSGGSKRWQRAAEAQLKRELDALEAAWRADGDTGALCRDISQLLRRVALRAFPDEEAAGLRGRAWLEFLDRRQLIAQRFTDPELAALLTTGPYAATPPEGDPERLLAACRAWMEQALRRAAAERKRG